MSDIFDKTLSSCIDLLGESVVYHQDGEEHQIKGVFSRTYDLYEGESYSGISNMNSMLGIDGGKIPFKPRQGDMVTHRGRKYQVSNYYRDSQSGIKLALKVVEA